MTSKCSVICNTYNHARFSQASLSSIFDQTYSNIEIIIVDDGSTDTNVEKIKDTIRQSPFPYKLISQKNTGNIPLNVNRGIAAASGEYLSFLSLDDLLLSESISDKMKLINTNRKVVFAANTCNQEVNEEGEIITECFKSPLYDLEISTAAELLEIEYAKIGTVYMQGTIVRADLVRAVGGMDEDISGDDLILRTKLFQHMLTRPEMEVALLHKPGMAYRKHDTNLHQNIWNQIKTVVDWKNRYFPNHPLPTIAESWIKLFVDRSIKQDDIPAIEKAREYDPLFENFINSYLKTWKCRRRRAKNILKRFFA